jgi:hypothetical protein
VKRHLQASKRLAGHLDWPGLKQVLRLERTTVKHGKTTTEIEYAITSLSAEPSQLLAFWVGHWGIENRSHWIRDVVFGEDACRARIGHSPQNLAALRNAGIAVLRHAGINEILPALRHHAAHAEDLLKRLRILKE